jgi:hypothetical protein
MLCEKKMTAPSRECKNKALQYAATEKNRKSEEGREKVSKMKPVAISCKL